LKQFSSPSSLRAMPNDLISLSVFASWWFSLDNILASYRGAVHMLHRNMRYQAELEDDIPHGHRHLLKRLTYMGVAIVIISMSKFLFH
jgi:hypothetical protein